MWVSPDWVTPSRAAARVKLPSSTAVSMASHFFVSMGSLRQRTTRRMSSMRPSTSRCSSSLKR